MGGWEPCEQGIRLTLRGYLELRHNFTEILRMIRLASADDLGEPWRRHIGDEIIISVTEEFPSLDIRRFYAPPTSINLTGDKVDLRPSKKGLYLSRVEVPMLNAVLDHVLASIPPQYLPEYAVGAGLSMPCSLSHNGDQFLCQFCCPYHNMPMAVDGKLLQ
jgi:hypothetical protein